MFWGNRGQLYVYYVYIGATLFITVYLKILALHF